MYERLPLDYIGITSEFGYRQNPITGIQQFHYGLDLGWHSYQGEPVYAIHDSEVVYEAYDVNLGNYIVLSYTKGNNTIIYRFIHLRDRTILNVGDKVSRGQVVGYMGTTGDSTGVHLHFEYWLCPLGYTYYYGDRGTYAVNPLDYCYLFDDQTVNSNSVSQVIKVVGMRLKKELDEEVDQIQVVGSQLRCRKEPNLNGEVHGYIDYGIYNILDTQDNDGYTWYKIDEDKWVAKVDGDVNIFQKDQEVIEEPNKPEAEEVDLKEYKSFKAEKNAYYYIYLKENEIIYFPK